MINGDERGELQQWGTKTVSKEAKECADPRTWWLVDVDLNDRVDCCRDMVLEVVLDGINNVHWKAAARDVKDLCFGGG